MLKKIWICTLAVLFVLCAAACAEGFEGAGTQENPYLIATADELIQLAEVMNDDNLFDEYYDCHFLLTADIALNDISGFDEWESNPPANVWTPIGYYHSFKGVFDGNGHKISGLYIDQAVSKDENNHMMDKFGLFGNSDGEIRNLTIANAYVHPKDAEVDGASINGGILAGTTGTGSVVSGCVVEGIVICEGYQYGGIVGSGNGKIADCCFMGNMIEKSGSSVAHIGGIAGYILTEKEDSFVAITGCTNEAALCGNMPGGIVGRIMQNGGNVRIEKCTNKGAITGEGSYAAGILCHIQQWGGNWNIVIDACVNEGDISTSGNAGGIVCFAYSVGKEPGCTLNISNCVNCGNLRSEGANNYMGGILGVDALAYVPVSIAGCTNEGNLDYTSEVLVDAETLSGALITLSRTSGGIVGYVGTAPYITLNSGERTLNNINTEDAYLMISGCSSTGNFIHKEAAFADDVDAAMLENWKQSGVDNVLNYFIALEGGIIGTIANEEAYSVKIADCSYANAEREMDDWSRFNAGRNN